MSTEGVIMDDASTCGSVPGSPKNKVKFLCSHGGKILPRPADGNLKYVGGETRIISVPRDIKFQELMKKLTYLIEGDMVLKYQLVPEDLDALVSVKSDEDLRHMFDEYDRYESTGTPRFRAFLFPAHPVLIENHAETNAIEQRYIDAINGIVRATAAPTKHHHFLHITPNASSVISSTSSSPRSPESNYTDAMPSDGTPPALHNYQYHSSHYGSRGHMHRVQSSPTIYNLNSPHQISPRCSHQYQKHHHHYYQSNRQQPPFYQPSKLFTDPHKGSSGPEKLISVRSVGRADGIRYQVDPAPAYHYTYSKHTGGSTCCSSKCVHFDEYASCSSDRRMEKAGSLSPSPLSMSPRHGHGHIVYRACDS